MKKFNFDKVRKMVAEGLKNGLVTISDNLFDYGVMDIGCKIGDNAFYFGGNEVEDMSLEEYNVSFDDEITTEMVSNTIWNMIGSEDFSDEGWYYIYYLDENLKNINGGKNMKVKELAKEIKKAVEALVASENGCSTIKLDDNLAICVGWSEGFDPKDDNLIHSKTEPTFCLVVGLKVWTSDDLRTDYDWINFPFFENQEVIDTEVTISDKEDYEALAKWLLKEYNDFITSYEIVSKEGLIKNKIEDVKYGIKISYSWGDEEEGLYGEYTSKEEAYKAMCQLASTEAYVQNEDFDENGSCAIYFDGYNKEINLHYDNDDTWCYYRIEIIK